MHIESCKPQGIQVSGAVSIETHFCPIRDEMNQLWVQALESLQLQLLTSNATSDFPVSYTLGRHMATLGLSHAKARLTQIPQGVCYPHVLLKNMWFSPRDLNVVVWQRCLQEPQWILIISKKFQPGTDGHLTHSGLHIQPRQGIIYLMRI